MVLRELLERVNQELTNNMNKEIIKTSKCSYSYDQNNGRKIINEFDLIKIINKEAGDIDILTQLKLTVNLQLLGINFKLKRKKSGLINDYSYKNQLTYSEITIEKNDEDKLDIELSELQLNYNNELLEKANENSKQEQYNAAIFKKKIDNYGITIEKFDELQSEFRLLTFNERRLLFK